MGNSQTINKINFEDIQFILKTDQKYIIINTLGEQEQSCLLPKTVKAHEEVELLTNLLKMGRKDVKLVVHVRERIGYSCSNHHHNVLLQSETEWTSRFR